MKNLKLFLLLILITSPEIEAQNFNTGIEISNIDLIERFIPPEFNKVTNTDLSIRALFIFVPRSSIFSISTGLAYHKTRSNFMGIPIKMSIHFGNHVKYGLFCEASPSFRLLKEEFENSFDLINSFGFDVQIRLSEKLKLDCTLGKIIFPFWAEGCSFSSTPCGTYEKYKESLNHISLGIYYELAGP